MVITTIERRFGLRSRQTGLVASGYDIASFICLVPVTYFGGRLGASKPRIIACGIVLLGLGSLTFALPHFLVGPYRATMSTTNTCSAANGDGNTTSLQVDLFYFLNEFKSEIVIDCILNISDLRYSNQGHHLEWRLHGRQYRGR